MTSSALRKSGLAAAAVAGGALIAIGVPLAIAVPTAAPPSDGQGYVDSTARCTAPDTAVIFGTTDTSRVAICKTAADAYQYRGVRVRDGAKLIATATQTGANTYVVKNDIATYTVTPQGLSVAVNGNTYRTESWTDYHGPQAPASTKSSTATTTSATTSATAATTSATTATTSATAASTSATAASTSATAVTTATTASSAAPLPPPLPAEAGGTSSTR